MMILFKFQKRKCRSSLDLLIGAVESSSFAFRTVATATEGLPRDDVHFGLDGRDQSSSFVGRFR